jgi:uncharacterized protein (TIGR00730 family)
MVGIGSVCVFCGSRPGNNGHYAAAAAALGRALAGRGIRLVYGGGHVGMMGILADAVLAEGGTVIGVIPDHLRAREQGHARLSEMHVVDSMHARKQKMFELSDAFAVLPGGVGTLDETFEIITWRQLGLHDKPIAILDADGYWQPLTAMIAALVANGFADDSVADLFDVVTDLDQLFAVFARAPERRVRTDLDRL